MRHYLIFLLPVFALISCGKGAAVKENEPDTDGLTIYSLKNIQLIDTVDGKACRHCFELTNENLDSAIISSTEIDDFDFNEQLLVVDNSAAARIREMEIPLTGVPVALVIDGEPIYGFWLWNAISSHSCDRVYMAAFGKEMALEFAHLPEWRVGADPRFDPRLEKYLEERIKNY